MWKFLKEYSYDIVKLLLSQVALAIFALVLIMFSSNFDNIVYMAVGMFSIIFYLYLLYTIVKDIGAKDRPAYAGGRAKPMWLKGFFISLASNSINILCAVLVFVFGFFIAYQTPVAVYNEQGEEIEIYYKDEDGLLHQIEENSIYTDTGDNVYTEYSFKNAKTETVIEYNNYDLTICDGDGNELQLFSNSGDTITYTQSASRVPTKTEDNWAHDIYAIPKVILTFCQAMYTPFHISMLGGADWFYLVMPIFAIAFCTIAYIFGLKDIHILPELKESKKKRMKY